MAIHAELGDDMGDAGRADRRQRRLFAVLAALYLGQGIPNYLLLVALPPIMREAGASRTAIGLFMLLMLPMLFKFAVAPFIDRHALVSALGHRRGWIIVMQVAVSLGIASLSLAGPTDTAVLFIICAIVVVLFSLQDIAADGYAIRALRAEDRAVGNAIQAGAIALGVIIGGTVSLVLYHHIGWQATMLTIAVISLAPLAAAAWMREEPDAKPKDARARPSITAFFRRPQAWMLLGFALTYRASEGLVKGMEGTYLVDLKVQTDWIGYLTGSAAATAGLAGAAIAAAVIRRFGLPATLILLGSLRTLCFIGFSLSALGILPAVETAMTASAFQTLIRYMELVAIYSFFMASSSSNQPGTDFTILNCAELLIYLIGGSIAGYFVDRLGYSALFLTATVVSLIGIALAVWFLRRIPGAADQSNEGVLCPP
jgi:PAT family beta-lactamase induction signal transducer AmpG